jgi:hypothetical protein
VRSWNERGTGEEEKEGEEKKIIFKVVFLIINKYNNTATQHTVSAQTIEYDILYRASIVKIRNPPSSLNIVHCML